MEMHVLEAKVCEATLCGSRAARRQMEVNSVEVKVFLAICPGEGLRGRKWRCTFLRRTEVNSVIEDKRRTRPGHRAQP